MRLTKTFLGALAASALIVVLALPAAAAPPVCGLNNGKPATGAPIPIGAVVGKTGPADFSGSARAAEAYFKCVNANGGIHGRPIAYTITDDAWNPEQAAQVATKLVRDTKVVAMVGNSSFMDCSANEAMYEAENVLVIGGVGVPRECFHARNYATTNGGPRMSGFIAAEYMYKTFGDKKFVCLSNDIPNVGPWACDGLKVWGQSKGIEVKVIPVNSSSVDATSTMLQAASFHPDDIMNGMSKEQAVELFAAAEQQGMIPKFHWSGLTSQYDSSVPKAIGPGWDNKLFLGAELQPFSANTPDMQNWRATLDKYAPGIPRDTFTQAGYLAARIATETLLKLDPAKINRATVAKAIRNIKGFRSDILCDPWYFGPGNEHNPVHAGVVVATTKDGFATKSGCIEDEDPDLTNIRKMEAEFHLTK